MRFSQDAVGLMAHVVVYLYRNKDPRGERLIRAFASRKSLSAQNILDWITFQAGEFSRRHVHDLERWDSGDIEEMIQRAPSGKPYSSRSPFDEIDDLVSKFEFRYAGKRAPWEF